MTIGIRAPAAASASTWSTEVALTGEDPRLIVVRQEVVDHRQELCEVATPVEPLGNDHGHDGDDARPIAECEQVDELVDLDARHDEEAAEIEDAEPAQPFAPDVADVELRIGAEGVEEATILASDEQNDSLAGRETIGLDDAGAVDAMRPQRGERRLGGGVVTDAARNRSGDALAGDIDRDIRSAPSRLGRNVVDREQFPRLRQRLDWTAERVRHQDASAAYPDHHAFPAQPSARRRSSTTSRTARRPAIMTSSGPPMPRRACGFSSSTARARRTAAR